MTTVVFFHAHPDDESIATGGTMVRLARAGHRVVIVLATRGELGEPVPGILADGEVLGARREVEAVAAARELGVERVEFLGYHDSGMMGEDTNDDPCCFWRADVDEAADRLAELLNEVEADVLVVYDEHGGYGHPDHIQVHRVGVAAARRAGVERIFEASMNRDEMRRGIDEAIAAGEADDELLERRAWLDEGTFGLPEDQLTHAIDVTSVLDRKRAALRAHASQISPDSFFLDRSDEEFARAFGTEWYRRHGAATRTGAYATDLLG